MADYYHPARITWLIDVPDVGRAGYSVREGNVFLHCSMYVQGAGAFIIVRQHLEQFWSLLAAKGFDVVYSVVPANDKKLNSFQTLCGLDFMGGRDGFNFYKKVI